MVDFTPALSRAYAKVLTAETITRDQWEEAESRVLSDMDGFTDWLGAACMNTDPVRLGFVPVRNDRTTAYCDRFSDRMNGMTVAELLCVALTKPQWASDAMVHLQSQYLADKRKRIHSIAGDL
jgi:hypothetical protein